MKTLKCLLQAGPPSLRYYCAVVSHSCIVLPPVGHSSNREWDRHLYTTTAPSCCIPVSYCHLSATLQTMSGHAIFTLLLHRRVAFLYRTATCRPLFKP